MVVDENGCLIKVVPSDLDKNGKFVVKFLIKSVAESAFWGVRKELRGVTFENGCEILGNHAFEGCENLVEVNLPNSLCEIGAGAFSRSGLKCIQIPARVKMIHHGAFMYCKDLEVVDFLGNVDGWKKHLSQPYNGTLLGNDVFCGCSSLKKIIYQKKPYDFDGDLIYHKNTEIMIIDDQEAEDFWFEHLKLKPLLYQNMDSVRLKAKRYQPFRDCCAKIMEESYKRRLGRDDVSALVEDAMNVERLSNVKENDGREKQ